MKQRRVILVRYWINQPSTLQPEHKHNGLEVLVEKYLGEPLNEIVEVWPTSGPIHSMRVHSIALSPGWPSTQ